MYDFAALYRTYELNNLHTAQYAALLTPYESVRLPELHCAMSLVHAS
jgi:hypothetical protein